MIRARIDRKELKNLAQLTRIELSKAEEDAFLKALDQIIGYAEALQAVDTFGVLPCYNVHEEMQAPLREDEVSESIDREQFLKCAPEQIAGLIKVPTVLEKSAGEDSP